MTYQIKAYGTLVYADALKFQQNSEQKLRFCILHLHYIAKSHAADRPLPGELAKTETKIKHEPLWMVEGVGEVACCCVPNAI